MIKPWEIKWDTSSQGLKPWQVRWLLPSDKPLESFIKTPETKVDLITAQPSETAVKSPQTEPALEEQIYKVPMAFGKDIFLPPGEYVVPKGEPEAKIIPAESKIKTSLRNIPPGLKGVVSGILFTLQPQELFNMAKGLGEVGIIALAELVKESSPTTSEKLLKFIKPGGEIPALRLPERPQIGQYEIDNAVDALFEQLLFVGFAEAFSRTLRNIKLTREYTNVFNEARGYGANEKIADAIARAKMASSILNRGIKTDKEQQIIDYVLKNIQETVNVDRRTAEHLLRFFRYRYGREPVRNLVIEFTDANIVRAGREAPKLERKLLTGPVAEKPVETKISAVPEEVAKETAITKEIETTPVEEKPVSPAKEEKFIIHKAEKSKAARERRLAKKAKEGEIKKEIEPVSEEDFWDLSEPPEEVPLGRPEEFEREYEEALAEKAKDASEAVVSGEKDVINIKQLEKDNVFTINGENYRVIDEHYPGGIKTLKVQDGNTYILDAKESPFIEIDKGSLFKNTLERRFAEIDKAALKPKLRKNEYTYVGKQPIEGSKKFYILVNDREGNTIAFDPGKHNVIAAGRNFESTDLSDFKKAVEDPNFIYGDMITSELLYTSVKPPEETEIQAKPPSEKKVEKKVKKSLIPEDELKKELEEGDLPVKFSDFNQGLAFNAYKYISQAPEQRAFQDIKSAKDELNRTYKELSELAKTDEQIELLNNEFDLYKKDYLYKLYEIWFRKSQLIPWGMRGKGKHKLEREQKKDLRIAKLQGDFELWVEKKKNNIKNNILKIEKAKVGGRRISGRKTIETKTEKGMTSQEEEIIETEKEIKPKEEEIKSEKTVQATEIPGDVLSRQAYIRTQLGRLPSDQPYKEVKVARSKFTRAAKTDQVDEDLKRILKPHQVDGVNLALESLQNRGGFLLADGTGAGKTMQQLAVAKIMIKKHNKPILIITENERIIKNSFMKDAKTLGIEIHKYDKDIDLKPAVYIATYNDITRGKVPFNVTNKISTIIFDESQNLKNMESSTKAIRGFDLANHTRHVMFASATPLDKPQHIRYLKKLGIYHDDSDFNRILDQLGIVKRKKTIETKYGLRQIEYYARKKDVSAIDMAIKLNRYFEKLTNEGRMLKREVSMDNLDIGIKTIQLPPEAYEQLSKIDEHYKSMMKGDPVSDALLKAQNLMAQRRALENYKIPTVLELTREELNRGKQVVIFATRINPTEVTRKYMFLNEVIVKVISQSEGTIREIEKSLAEEYGPNSFSRVYGSNPRAHEEIAKFQSGKTKILIATPQSGGTGINLDDITGENPRTLIIMTPPFSAMEFIQGVGRVIRLTTKSRAKVYAIFTDTNVDAWNKDIISYKMKAVGASVSGEVEKLDVDKLKEFVELGEYETIDVLSGLSPKKNSFINAVLRDIKGENLGIIYDPFRNIKEYFKAKQRTKNQMIDRQQQPGADPSLWEHIKTTAKEYIGTRMEQYIAWTGSVERGKTIYHLERNERINNNILRKAIYEDTRKRFRDVPKEAREKIFRALQGIRGLNQNNEPIFGALQRAGVKKRNEIAKMALMVGDELPDGRIIGDLIESGGELYHQLYRIITPQEAKKLYDEALAASPKAKDLITQYLSPYEMPMVTSRGLRVPPFSAPKLKDVYQIEEELSKGINLTPDKIDELVKKGYSREILEGPIPYVPSIPKEIHIFPATRKLVRTFVRAFSKYHAPGRLYKTGELRETGEELEDIAKATVKRRMEFAAEDQHNRIVAMMIASALEPLDAQNPLKPNYVAFNLGYFKDAETQSRLIAITKKLSDLFIANGINPEDLINVSIQAGGGLPKYQIHNKLLKALAKSFEKKEDSLYQALYDFVNAGVRAITGNWLLRPSTLNRNFISNKVFMAVKTVEDFYRGLYLYLFDSDYPYPFANVMFDILSQVPRVINPYKMRVNPKKAITDEMLGKAIFGDWEEEEALSLRKYWFYIWNKLELMDKRLVKWSEMYAEALREYIRINKGKNPLYPALDPQIKQLAIIGEKEGFIDAFILNMPDAVEWGSYEVMDRWELDYNNIPIWLDNFLKSPVGKGLTPYIKFFYKFSRQFADLHNYPGNLVKWFKARQAGDKKKAAKYMAKILTAITLNTILWNSLDNEDDLEGRNVPYYLDTFGRVEISPGVWVRLYDIPYIGEIMFMRSLWYKGKSGMDYFTDRFSLGPIFGITSWLTGRGTKYDLVLEGGEFKPSGARLGAEIAGWLPPFVDFARKLIDSNKRMTYDEYQGFLANLWIGLASKLPLASKLLEPKKTVGGEVIEYDIQEEMAKFFLLNIKNPDIEDYERGIRFIINLQKEAIYKARTGRRSPENVEKEIEYLEEILELIEKARKKLEKK